MWIVQKNHTSAHSKADELRTRRCDYNRAMQIVRNGLAISLIFASAMASGAQAPEKVRVPSIVHGGVGGESHQSYVFEAKCGDVIRVKLSWKHKHDKEFGRVNLAQFSLSRSDVFADDLGFGQYSADERTWTGTMPKEGSYYIYVIAYPIADFTLKLSKIGSSPCTK